MASQPAWHETLSKDTTDRECATHPADGSAEEEAGTQVRVFQNLVERRAVND
jgi:hypothetical protein